MRETESIGEIRGDLSPYHELKNRTGLTDEDMADYLRLSPEHIMGLETGHIYLTDAQRQTLLTLVDLICGRVREMTAVITHYRALTLPDQAMTLETYHWPYPSVYRKYLQELERALR